MKKLLLFFLALSLSFAGFSQDGDSDHKWLVGASTGAMYMSSDYQKQVTDAILTGSMQATSSFLCAEFIFEWQKIMGDIHSIS